VPSPPIVLEDEEILAEPIARVFETAHQTAVDVEVENAGDQRHGHEEPARSHLFGLTDRRPVVEATHVSPEDATIAVEQACSEHAGNDH
jgi:hypothetical protein